jgi:hypothetical protein
MILFTEIQKFRQWWIWVIVIVVTGLEINLLIQKLSGGLNSISLLNLISFSLINICVALLLLFSKLHTIISDKGISYKFFPFHLAQKTIAWTDLEKAFIRTYNPIGEYGGWGFRLGIFGFGKALNVSGNIGLQLVLKNGKRLLIGTNKPNELTQALNKIDARKIFNSAAS